MPFRLSPQRVALLKREENPSGETEKERQDVKLRKAHRSRSYLVRGASVILLGSAWRAAPYRLGTERC